MNTDFKDEVDRGLTRRREELFAFCKRVAAIHGLLTADPAEVLIYMAATGRNPIDHTLPLNEQRVVPIECQIDAAKLVIPFMRPKLTSLAISENSGRFAAGPVETTVSKQLMQNREIRALYENMQIGAANLVADDEAVN